MDQDEREHAAGCTELVVRTLCVLYEGTLCSAAAVFAVGTSLAVEKRQ